MAMTMRSFYWRYFRRYLLWAVVAAVGILAFAGATGAMVYLIEPLFGEVLLADADDLAGVPIIDIGGEEEEEEESSEADAGPAWLQRLKVFDPRQRLDDFYGALKARFGIDSKNVVVFVPILFVIVFTIRSVGDFVGGYAFQHIGLGVTNDVRNDLYRRILQQSSRFHASHPSGELVSRVVSDVAMMQNAVSNRLLDFFQQLVTLVALLALLLSTNLRLALICLIVAPALVYPIVRFGKGMRRYSYRSQERLADLGHLVSEGVRGHRVIKVFDAEDFELKRFFVATRRHLRINLWAQMLAHLSSPVVETLAVIGAGFLLVYAGQEIRSQGLTSSAFIAFLINLALMYDPIRKLNRVNLILQQALAAGERVLGLMEIPNEIEEKPEAVEIDAVRQGIRYESVSFAYDTTPVLDKFDLEIGAGEIVALVGPSGAGKSTVVNLLPRFFDPVEGAIRIDGIDLRDLKLNSLRRLVGMVTQETVLFHDTIRHNIAYGRQEVSDETVRAAAAAAYADEFIDQMPDGYESQVGESGHALSGGQRQRVAIARALLKNAPILILDEATSQLDSESEALVQKALYNLMQDRTTLVIAHRLSTVMKADRILVMERGRIVEHGSHAQLLEQGGTYRRLYDLQFRE